MSNPSNTDTLETSLVGIESSGLTGLRQKTFLDLIRQVDNNPCLLTVREGEVISLTIPILSDPADPLLSADLTSLSKRILRDLVIDGYITHYWELKPLTTPDFSYVFIAVRPGPSRASSGEATL